MTDIIKEIENLDPTEFNNLEEYRKFIIKVKSILSTKLKQGAEININIEDVKLYIASLISTAIYTKDRFPSIPLEFKHKDRSPMFKDIISEIATNVIKDTPDDKLTVTAIDYIVKSKTLAELRKALRLYRDVKSVVSELEDIDSFSSAELEDFFISGYNDLEFYKQQNQELISAMTYDDRNVYNALQVHKLYNKGKGRPSIAKELNLTECQVRTYLEKYKFDNTGWQKATSF